MQKIRTIVDPHLPYLRRYGRAVSGQQDAGDYVVSRLLEDLVERRTRLSPETSNRVALYQSVARTLCAQGLVAIGGSSTEQASAELPLVTSLQRHAFLLVAIERLSVEEAAQILGLAPAHAGELAEQGRHELSDLDPASVLIIERSPLVAMDWAMRLEYLGHTVVGSVHTTSDALALSDELRPDLVLAGSLLDGRFAHATLNQVAHSYGARLVIMSSYPEFSLTAERVEAAYVIHKADPDSVLDAIIRHALYIQRFGALEYQPADAAAALGVLRGETGVIISTEAARQFTCGYAAQRDVFSHTLGPSLRRFLEHFGFEDDVTIVSYPVGLVAWRSHARVTLRKNAWTTSRRFCEIVSIMSRELRDPPAPTRTTADR